MRRSSVLESIDKETELSHGSLWGKAKNLEHLFLKASVMDTQRTSTNFYSVADEVVSHGTHLFRMRVKQRYIVWIRQGERMMSSHKTLFFVAPLKQGEIYDPQTFKFIFVAKSQTVTHLQSQSTQLCTSLIGFVAT